MRSRQAQYHADTAPTRIRSTMNRDAELRQLAQQVLGQKWTPHQNYPATWHSRRPRLTANPPAAPGRLFGTGLLGRIAAVFKSAKQLDMASSASNSEIQQEDISVSSNLASELPPTTMIGTRPTVTIACPRTDYDTLKHADAGYTKTLTLWQRLMRPRPLWKRLED